MSTVINEGAKVYIAGVRRISWDTGEMCEFASTLVSALGALGESISYHYLMGTSGAAFRFTLKPGAWDLAIMGSAISRPIPTSRSAARLPPLVTTLPSMSEHGTIPPTVNPFHPATQRILDTSPRIWPGSR